MTLGFLALLIVLFLTGVMMYNGLIKKKNYVDEAFSGMDIALKKRHDLLPNLIETVKAYMKHEMDLLTKVTELRAKAMNPNLSVNDKVLAENQLSRAVGGLMIAVEKYPDIKANTNFMHIQESMKDIEFEISGARKHYNSTVTEFNNAVEMFPTNVLAKFMGLARRAFFEIPDTERENVDVKGLFGNS
ncbi:MAG: LemA family protein [Chitinophagales bacterium]|nr:LemA family protein [Bacteroidota bacterium]MCB9257198.1 LemA family protein [Chitinophagales bacterium]